MSQCFEQYLINELNTARNAVVILMENRDDLLYHKAPVLRQRYMDAFAAEEEPVLAAELEVTLLRKKLTLIQAAVNRREKPDLKAIEAELEAERQKLLGELEAGDSTLMPIAVLDKKDEEELRSIYRKLIDDFHPTLNGGLSDTQKKLYDQAAEAYRLKDLEALKLIDEMLRSPSDNGMTIELEPLDPSDDPAFSDMRADYAETVRELEGDHELAKEIFPFFEHTENDLSILEHTGLLQKRLDELTDETEKIKNGFPFNAEAVINDPGEAEQYRRELKERAALAAAEKKRLDERIARLTEVDQND